MTVAAGHVTTEPAPSTPSPDGVPQAAEAPRLAEGVELLGEYKDSGYNQPPSLVRRPDGQIIQMSPLLYRVMCRIDGSRNPAAIAKLVSEDLGRTLNAEQVRHLVTAKLLPLGVVAGEAAPSRPPTANPLLALRARGTLLPERAANAAGTLLRPLFHGPLVVAVVGCVLAVDYWLFVIHGLGGGIEQVLRDPVDLLVVLGLTVVSAAFHECGHATGCRYGGARPGVVGVGIYLIWPSFFTNVTDSYRLSRAAAADRPRWPVLQPDLHAGPGRALRGHLGRGPAAGHRDYAPGDAGAAAAVRPLRRLFHPQRPGRRAGPVRPDRPPAAQRRVPGPQGPAGYRPAPPRADPGDRLGAVRPPAAFGRPRVSPAAPARDQPGPVARRNLAGAPDVRRPSSATATRWP